MAFIRVRYQVVFEALMEVDDGENLDDAASEVEIPEGGEHNSKYEVDTFEVLKIETLKPGHEADRHNDEAWTVPD
jgi:hypothetical protein